MKSNDLVYEWWELNDEKWGGKDEQATARMQQIKDEIRYIEGIDDALPFIWGVKIAHAISRSRGILS